MTLPGTPTHTPPNRWYNQVNQTIASSMLSKAIRRYSGAPSESGAWSKIIRHFNGGARYVPGQTVFIKINLTTAYAGSGTANIYTTPTALFYDWKPSGSLNYDSIGPTAELIKAILHQLVYVVGVAQSDITVGDPTGLWYNELYDPVHSAFPNVVYLDNYGPSGSGRTQAQWSTVRQYWSTSEASGKANDYVLSAMADAEYVINLAILKSHDLNGITLTAKNHFGSMIRTPNNALRGTSWRLAGAAPLPAPVHRRPDPNTRLRLVQPHGPVPAASGPERPRQWRRQDDSLHRRGHLRRQELGLGAQQVGHDTL